MSGQENRAQSMRPAELELACPGEGLRRRPRGHCRRREALYGGLCPWAHGPDLPAEWHGPEKGRCPAKRVVGHCGQKGSLQKCSRSWSVGTGATGREEGLFPSPPLTVVGEGLGACTDGAEPSVGRLGSGDSGDKEGLDSGRASKARNVAGEPSEPALPRTLGWPTATLFRGRQGGQSTWS